MQSICLVNYFVVEELIGAASGQVFLQGKKTWLVNANHLRRIVGRERRLKAGKMLRWSILSESPSSYAAKAEAAHW